VRREALEGRDRGNQNDAAAIADERKRLLNSEQQAASVDTERFVKIARRDPASGQQLDDLTAWIPEMSTAIP